MDPITAVQAASAIHQLVVAGYHICERIHDFVKEGIELPQNLKDFRRRASLLLLTLKDLELVLNTKSAAFSPSDLDVLGSSVSSTRDLCQLLVVKIENWLPQKGERTGKRIKAALCSPFRDREIKELAERLNSEIPSLHLASSRFLAIQTSGDKGPKLTVDERLTGRKFFDIPQRQVRDFVNRANILFDVQQTFDISYGNGGRLKVVVLQGMGGQGKTQLALEYARKSQAEGRYKAIFWVDSATESSVTKGFERISEYLKEPNQNFSDFESRIRFVKGVLSQWSASWLIVFDNYDHPPSAMAEISEGTEAFDIVQFFPSSTSGHILVTSRSPHAERLASRNAFKEVKGMTEEEASTLFRDCCEIGPSDVTYACAKAIVKRLGFLPLAIRQAATYLRGNKERLMLRSGDLLTLENFLQHYEEYAQEILGCSSTFEKYIRDSRPSNNPAVFATWKMSYSLLKPETTVGSWKADFLSVLSFFDETDISEELFAAYLPTVIGKPGAPSWTNLFIQNYQEPALWDKIVFRNCFFTLMNHFRDLSLVASVSAGFDKYLHVSLHPLVRDWIRLRQSLDEAERSFQIAANILATSVEVYLRLVPHNIHYGSWDFRLASRQKAFYLSHILTWAGYFNSYEHSIRPQVIELRTVGFSYCVEVLLAVFIVYQSSNIFAAADILKWVLEKTPDSEGSFCQHISGEAGTTLMNIFWLSAPPAHTYCQGLNIIEKLRESSCSDCLRLLQTSHIVEAEKSGIISGEQAESLLLPLLQETEHDPLSINHIAIQTSFIAIYCRQSNRDMKAKAAEISARILYSSQLNGGKSYRESNWPLPTWLFVMNQLPPDLYHQIVLEAEDTLGAEGSRLHFSIRLCKGELCLAGGDYLSASKIAWEVIQELDNASGASERYAVVWAWRLYGEATMESGMYPVSAFAFQELLKKIDHNPKEVLSVVGKLAIIKIEAGDYEGADSDVRRYQDIAEFLIDADDRARSFIYSAELSLLLGSKALNSLRIERFQDGYTKYIRALELYRDPKGDVHPSDRICWLRSQELEKEVGGVYGFQVTISLLTAASWLGEAKHERIIGQDITREHLLQAMHSFKVQKCRSFREALGVAHRCVLISTLQCLDMESFLEKELRARFSDFTDENQVVELEELLRGLRLADGKLIVDRSQLIAIERKYPEYLAIPRIQFTS
ncbi:hypothetical protein ABW19_dt0207299 [Dactylella cylindrospora]|nr:hypothetical protein ABW19_dt0207299 [Dactylella cylindrospora]